MDLQVVLHGFTGHTPRTLQVKSMGLQVKAMDLQFKVYGITDHTLWSYRSYSMDK